MCISITLTSDCSISWLSASTQFGVFCPCLHWWEVCWAGVNTHRCWQFRGLGLCRAADNTAWPPPSPAAGSGSCFYTRYTGRTRVCILPTKRGQFWPFLKDRLYKQCSLFLLFFFPRMPNESEISISFYNNIVSLNESTVGRPFWGNAELPQRYSISLFNQLVCVHVGFFHLLVGAVHWALTKIKHHYVTLTKQIWINMSAGAGWQRGALSSTWNGRNNFLSSFSWHDGIDRVFSTARHGSGVDGPLTLGCICHSLTLELMWCLSQRRDELKQGNADSKSWLSGISATAVSH